jgi:23S rRNA (adenine2030-N6)-methyltransferase
VDGLARAARRWRGGTYCLWYPLKQGAPSEAFHSRLATLGLDDVLGAELWVRSLKAPTGLNGSGLIIVNPPYTLEQELAVLLPVLHRILAQDKGAGSRCWRIAG